MNSGFFSLCLRSLQAQAQGLFDGVGGEGTIKLLDQVSRFTAKDQEILVDSFCKIAKEIADNKNSSSPSKSEKISDEIVSSMCKNILRDLYSGSLNSSEPNKSVHNYDSYQEVLNKRQLTVLNGGLNNTETQGKSNSRIVSIKTKKRKGSRA